MAVITANAGVAFDMYETAIVSALTPTVASVAPTRIILNFDGGFSDVLDLSGIEVDANGMFTAGKITRVEESRNGAVAFTIEDLHVSILSLAPWSEEHDYQSMFARMLSGDDIVTGSGLDDRISAYGGNDVIKARAGDDEIDVGTGINIVDGGDGMDTLLLAGSTADYSYLKGTDGDFLVAAGGQYRVSNVESFYFEDDNREVDVKDLSTALTAFDGLHYVAGYDDLRMAFGTNGAAAARHYAAHGFAEGRNPLAFDAATYTAAYADLRAAFGKDAAAATQHYIQHGADEGRTARFDGLAYLASYADLRVAYGADGDAGARHFILYGENEGRTITFNANSYLAANPTLIDQFGANAATAAEHYITTGAAEGLSADGFDAYNYLASYADLRAVYETDTVAATQHYVRFGYAEGRATTFDAMEYIASYADLIAAFGTNAEAGAKHFLTAGLAEGRTVTFDADAYAQEHPELYDLLGKGELLAEHYIETVIGTTAYTAPPSGDGY